MITTEATRSPRVGKDTQSVAVPRALPLPPQLPESFTTTDARDAGVARSRLSALDLAHPFHGARSRSVPVGVHDLAAALRPLLSEQQRFSHVTAALLHGMRMPEGWRDRRLHVSGQNADRAMRRPGVVGHTTTLEVTPVSSPFGLPLSSPVDTWAECAELMGTDDLIVMGDGLLRRRGPACAIDELATAVRRRRGRRGASRLRAALPHLRAGTDSARETMLRLLLTRAGLPEPLVNAELRDSAGHVIAHGDLVWPDERLVVEYDGRQHAEDPAQFAIDIRRLDDIAAAGFRVIRVDRDLMSSPTALAQRVRRGFTGRERS